MPLRHLLITQGVVGGPQACNIATTPDLEVEDQLGVPTPPATFPRLIFVCPFIGSLFVGPGTDPVPRGWTEVQAVVDESRLVR